MVLRRPCITSSRIGSNGRLGNQMFQIAAVVGQQDRFEIRLPGWGRTEHNPWNYASYFPHLITYPTRETLPIWEEPHFHFAPIPENGKGWDLSGYFQSEKYFESFTKEVSQAFTFREDIVKEIKILYPDIKWSEACAIHIRRGDYVQKQDCHPLLSSFYYQQSISLINTHTYLVFSDDLEWCQAAPFWPQRRTNRDHPSSRCGPRPRRGREPSAPSPFRRCRRCR